MPKTIVIAGSASLRERAEYWKKYWLERGYDVLDYPKAIPRDTFVREYPAAGVQSHEEIKLWLELGWIEVFQFPK